MENGNDDSANGNSNPSQRPASPLSKDIVIPTSCCCCRKDDDGNGNGDGDNSNAVRVNHNVFLNLVLAVLYGISGSLWNGTAYAAYLKRLGGDRNGPLGDIEAVSGLASLLTALPVGYLADKVGRSRVIRAGGVLLLVTTVLQIGVLEWVGTDDGGNVGDVRRDGHTAAALWMCGVIMALWGVGDGVVNGPAMALFADSTPEGQRSKYFTYMFVAYTAASACGPLVSILLFQTLGDDWDLYHLRIVIYVGLVVEMGNSVLMMLFDDRKALDEGDDAEEGEEDASGGADGNHGCAEGGSRSEDPAETLEDGSSFVDEPPEHGAATSTAEAPEAPTILTPMQKRQKWVPYIVFSQGLIFAMGSGMTVKFFPLFFKDEVGMSPSQVQIIYVIVPFVMVIASTFCTKLAGAGFGRVQTMLLFSCLGISLLYSMVVFKSYLDHHPFLLVPIYVLRTSLMNASYPIQESILMDFVPKEERARWKSLDSVASFGWCGSAALGGWLADKYDYTYTFLITAMLQSIGAAVWCLLLPLVPRQEGDRSEGGDLQEGGSRHRRGGRNVGPGETSASPSSPDDQSEGAASLTQPLLTAEDGGEGAMAR